MTGCTRRVGRASVPPERLLKAPLLISLYNLLFRSMARLELSLDDFHYTSCREQCQHGTAVGVCPASGFQTQGEGLDFGQAWLLEEPGGCDSTRDREEVQPEPLRGRGFWAKKGGAYRRRRRMAGGCCEELLIAVSARPSPCEVSSISRQRTPFNRRSHASADDSHRASGRVQARVRPQVGGDRPPSRHPPQTCRVMGRRGSIQLPGAAVGQGS